MDIVLDAARCSRHRLQYHKLSSPRMETKNITDYGMIGGPGQTSETFLPAFPRFPVLLF